MIYLYFVWDGNELKVKRIAFYCYFLWLIYNICVFSIAGIISNCVSIISTFIAVYNEKKIDKESQSYEVCEISYNEIKGANEEFVDWINKHTK